MKKRIVSVLMICYTAFVLAACGSSMGSYDMASAVATQEPSEESFYDYENMSIESDYEVEKAEESAEEGITGETSQSTRETTKRKLIKTVNMNVQTEHYDELMNGLVKKIEELGGYIEYKDAYHGTYYNQSNRRADITARIPAAKLEDFTSHVAKEGNVTYESESVEDVTLTYVDLTSHKKVLLAEQDRLMELLNNADTMEDIIALESRLSEVRYQIESMESRLRTYDNLVDYSTVHINVEEVERITQTPKKTAWDRIRIGFRDNVYRVTQGIQNFLIEFVIAIPVLIVWAFVIGILIFVIRMVRKWRKNHFGEKPKKKLYFRRKEQIPEERKGEEKNNG